MNTFRTQAGWRIFALSVAFVGLTLSAHAVVVTFPDTHLETAIRNAISKPTGDILDSDLLALTRFEAVGAGIANLSGIEYCANLTDLRLDMNQIVNLSPLAGLNSLTFLILGGNQIRSVSPLGGLTGLVELCLYDNQIVDVSPLASLTSLMFLLLPRNQIIDVSPLASLTSLPVLDLSGNQIADVTPLAGLVGLTALGLDDNQIADVTPLAGLTSLAELDLDNNRIADVTALADLIHLIRLALSYNQVVDVGPLVGLTSLRYLFLSVNQISDVSTLASLISLRDLHLDVNQITDISALLGNTGLGTGDFLALYGDPLSAQACADIAVLEARGVEVYRDACGGEAFAFTETPHGGQYRQGDSLTLTVAFVRPEGGADVQWTKNGVDIPSETSYTLSIPSLTVDDTAAYRARVTDGAKSVHFTPPAIVTVTVDSPLPLATPLTLFLSLVGVALAGALVMRRVKKGLTFVKNE